MPFTSNPSFIKEKNFLLLAMLERKINTVTPMYQIHYSCCFHYSN